MKTQHIHNKYYIHTTYYIKTSYKLAVSLYKHYIELYFSHTVSVVSHYRPNRLPSRLNMDLMFLSSPFQGCGARGY